VEPDVCFGSLIEENTISIAFAVPAFIADAPPDVVAEGWILLVVTWTSLEGLSDFISD
jgi:hypothetical protein